MRRRTPHRAGFTLIELLMAISIILLVAGMMVPVVRTFTSGAGVDSAMNELRGYLLLARQTAVQQHRPTAVFFLEPTPISPMQRIMIFQEKANAQGASRAHISNWKILPGAYGIKVPEGLAITNSAGQLGANDFCIIYDPQGFIPPDCPDKNLSLRIGSREGVEHAIRPRVFAIGRATGSILKLDR